MFSCTFVWSGVSLSAFCQNRLLGLQSPFEAFNMFVKFCKCSLSSFFHKFHLLSNKKTSHLGGSKKEFTFLPLQLDFDKKSLNRNEEGFAVHILILKYYITAVKS